MNVFVGQFQHSLDAKGRLILPVKFRPAFEHGGYLAPDTGGCISLWTSGEFIRRATEYEAVSSAVDDAGKQRSRFWAAASSEVEVDRQGRFALPPNVRKIGALEDDVIIIGHLSHVELWSPERFAARVEAASEFFLERASE